jgi:chromosome partitioning protein
VPPKRAKLQTIVLAATKGGVGKTTLASALAVRAASDGSRVALLDTDPQRSLARWHELRGLPPNPKIIDVDATTEALGLVRAQRWDYLIADTPPAMLELIQAAIYIADFVVIPLRPGAMDIEAVKDVVYLSREEGKPFAFLINQMPPQGFDRLAIGARKYLEGVGPVFKTQVGFRKSYVSAMTLGKTGPELKDGKAAGAEIDAVWGELQQFVRAHHER